MWTEHLQFLSEENDLTKYKSFDEITNALSIAEMIAQSKISDYPSITNKTIFKHMDILDEM